MEPTIRQRLYKDQAYLSLPIGRRRLAHAIIVDGKTFPQACREHGANSTRESKNIPLQILLATYAPTTAAPKRKPEPWEDEEQEARVALFELIERLEGKDVDPTVTDEAIYAAQAATDQPITVPEAGLDAARIARMIGIIKNHMTKTLASLNAHEAAAAELASRTICSRCQGAVVPPGTIAGVDVYCPTCTEGYNHTGNFAACAQPQCPTCKKHGLSAD